MKFEELATDSKFTVVKHPGFIWTKINNNDAIGPDNIQVDNMLLDMEVKLFIELDNLTTPSSRWKVNGEPDPHFPHYDGERAKLCMGNLTDDELANEAYLKYDSKPPIEDLVKGKARMPIAYMTAVKERIRWLSRTLEKELARNELRDLKNKVSALRAVQEIIEDDNRTTGSYSITIIGDMIKVHMEQVRLLETKLEILAGEPHH